MSPRQCSRARAIAVIVIGGLVAGVPSFAGGGEIHAFVVGRTPGKMRDRPRTYLQTQPELTVDDGRSLIPVGRIGVICWAERSQGDKLLVCVRRSGLHGWVPASALVPVTKAEAYFSRQIAANPQDSFAFLMRSVARIENGDRERAFADVNAAIRLDPKLVWAWVNRADLWHAPDELDAAVADLDEAIRLDPKNSYAYIARGMSYFGLKKPDQAWADFEKARSLGSAAPRLHIGLAMIHMERREWEPAIAELNRAIEIDPAEFDSYVFLAHVYTLQSKHEKALALFNHLVAIYPQTAEAREARAIHFIQRRNYQDALKDLNAAIELEPSSARYLNTRAMLYCERDDFRHALADLDAAIRLDPRWEEAVYTRANLLATCPDPAYRNAREAVATATRACELTHWNDPRRLAVLGAAYSEVGDLAAAVKWQQNAIDLSTADHPDWAEFRRALMRYKAGKPYHQLGVLEELGLRHYRPPAATSERAPG